MWWSCKNGHEWESIINSRAKGSGCPYCSGFYAIAGENDLQTVFPGIVMQWDYEKNGDLKPFNVLPHSEKRYIGYVKMDIAGCR